MPAGTHAEPLYTQVYNIGGGVRGNVETWDHGLSGSWKVTGMKYLVNPIRAMSKGCLLGEVRKRSRGVLLGEGRFSRLLDTAHVSGSLRLCTIRILAALTPTLSLSQSYLINRGLAL